MIVIDGRGLGDAIGEYLTLGRSRVSSTVGAKPVEIRILEGSHFVKGRFLEFLTGLAKPLTSMVASSEWRGDNVTWGAYEVSVCGVSHNIG